MPMRVQEFHPAIAHFPVALLPTAVAADVIGRIRNDPQMMEMGRRLTPLAVASMALTGIAGFAAQGAVRTDERSEQLLITHRTLNVSSLILGGVLAYYRARQRKPGMAYLAAGLGMSVVLTYSGYLGGRMVYEHGVGVRSANGLLRNRAPQYPGSRLTRLARLAAGETAGAMVGMVRDTARGRLAPVFQETPVRRTRSARKSSRRATKSRR